ncbi:MAG: phytoene desaturase family protein [Promethearchaeota archaeon]
MKIIIIGSGIAGLSAAAYLAREGHDVIIYEYFFKIGGVTATIHQNGYSWDLGPLLLGGLAPHEDLGIILEELGIAEKVELVREDRGQWFPDFQIWPPKEYKGPKWRREYLKEIFPEDSEGLDNYYEFYDKMVEINYIINQRVRTKGLKAFLLKLKLLFKFFKVKKYQNMSAADVLDEFFTNPKLKAVYAGILADMVVKPSEFPGLGVPLTNIETAFDKRIPIDAKWGKRPIYMYVKHGCETLVHAFADYITAHGGKIHINSTVEKILIQNNQAVGIKLKNGQEEYADIVIASGGMFNTFFNLIGKEHLPDDLIHLIETRLLMESVFMVHLGVDMDPTKFHRAALCYYYLTYDIEEGVERCRRGIYHEGKDGFVIYIYSMHSPDMAPPGKHAITIYTIAPRKLKESSWEDKKEEFCNKLIKEAEKFLPGLFESIETKIIMTPEDFKKRINVCTHSFGGTAPVMNMKNPAHQTPIKNLFYIGAYSESGGGVAGAAAGARNVVLKMILKKNERTIL